MAVVRASSRGLIVIAKEFRNRLGIGAGRTLRLRLVEGHLEVVPLPEEPAKALRGMIEAQAALATELLEERRKNDAGHEDQEEPCGPWA